MKMIRTRLGWAALVALALALALGKVPLANSQGLTVVVAQVSGALPVQDPDSSLWQQSTAVEIPLSAQNSTRPMLAETRVKAVTVRALHNEKDIAFLVEWSDATRDDATVRIQDFRDAVALQFPLSNYEPLLCMGQSGGDVNIWQWKADWQADITVRRDVNTQYPNMNVDQYPFADPAAGIAAGPGDYLDPNYVPALAAGNLYASPVRTSPVEDLVAGGFGTLTSLPAASQNVQGFGTWKDGKWRVILSRYTTRHIPEDANFAPGWMSEVAFAAWDGSNGERNGQKSTSQWVSLQVQGRPAAPASTERAPLSGEGLMFLGVPMALVSLLVLGLAGGAVLISGVSRSKE